MTCRWIKILLVASLALNLAFIAKMIFSPSSSPSPSPTFASPFPLPFPSTRVPHHDPEAALVHEIETDLVLRPHQKEEIKKIMRKFRLTMMNHKQTILEKRMDIIETISNPDSTPEEITPKVKQLNETENKLNLAFVDTLTQVSNVLDADQRLTFMLKISKPWFFMGRPVEKRHEKGEEHEAQKRE